MGFRPDGLIFDLHLPQSSQQDGGLFLKYLVCTVPLVWFLKGFTRMVIVQADGGESYIVANRWDRTAKLNGNDG